MIVCECRFYKNMFLKIAIHMYTDIWNC
jgi:hypothetical protein